MHAELAASLEHVAQASDEVLTFSPRFGALLAQLQNGVSFPAIVFANYYALVEALIEGDVGQAQALVEELAAAEPSASDLKVVSLGSPALGERSEVYQRLMSSDAGLEIGFIPPSEQVAAQFELRLRRGLNLLGATLPELAGEIEAIIREIVIAGSDPTKAMQFDGGSHYRLWGSLFLNGQFHHDDLAVVEVLAHESAHSLLFGFCTHEPLVENEDDELFASPLRPDKRPMDGIYHATFVSARMHWAMSRLAKMDQLDAAQRAQAEAAAASDLSNFWSGYGVVAEHGRLTPLGDSLLQNARAYIDSVQ